MQAQNVKGKLETVEQEDKLCDGVKTVMKYLPCSCRVCNCCT